MVVEGTGHTPVFLFNTIVAITTIWKTRVINTFQSGITY
jgi:hypothetical protein